MKQVTLSPAFFRKERSRQYTDWMSAWHREMLQNAGDSPGNNRVDFRFEELGNDLAVEVEDNGAGMSREIIDNVFFAYGETGKDTIDDVGGHGRARGLTCFSMKSYEFWTRNLHCWGKGIHYDVEEVDSSQRGCKFRIVIDDMTKERMVKSLRAVLGMSQLPYRVFIDGIQFTNWRRKMRLAKEASFGNIHVNKSASSQGMVIVRVKGLWMFSVASGVEAQVVVEVDPYRSRDILVINRDGFHASHQNDLNRFLQRLAVDTRSALRTHIRRKTRLIEGTGMLKTDNTEGQPTWVKNERDAAIKVAREDGRDIAGTTEPVKLEPVDMAARSAGGIVPVYEDVEEEVIPGTRFQTNMPSIYINDSTDNPRIRKVIDNFDPTKWVNAVKLVRGVEQHYRKGAGYMKLLITWRVACEEAVRCLLRTNRGYMSSVNWMVGWTFDDDAGACHQGVGNGHALCLNPVNAEGKLRFKFRDRQDQKRMMALAKHEAAHIIEPYHDERYANILTDIDERYDERVVYGRIREALAAV